MHHYNNQNKKEAYPDSIGPLYLNVENRTEEQSRQASCTLVRHERQPLITFSQDFANQRIGGGVVPSNPTIRITTIPNPISQSTFRSSERTASFVVQR